MPTTPSTGEAGMVFENVWQLIEVHSGSTAGLMDFAGMAKYKCCLVLQRF